MRRLSLAILVAALAGSAGLVTTTPAAASGSSACGSRVINDWYDNGRIDGTYPIACYRAALNELPEDVIQYADAHDVISRALSLAIINSKKGNSGGNTPSSPTSSGTTTTQTTTTGTTPTETTTTGTSTTKHSGAGPATTTTGGSGPTGPDPSPVPKVIQNLGPSSANSVPVPLLILGGLALLLLAAGAAGVVARKLQERRVPATPGGSTPSEPPSAA